jgi:uncharacterized membrane protein
MLDEDAVSDVLTEAEAGSHAEIRVATEDDPDADLDAVALKLWRELDLDDLGVIVLVAVGRREIRVVAGPALLAATDAAFWQTAADRVAEGFRNGDPVTGLRRALGPVGELCRRVAPLE